MATEIEVLFYGRGWKVDLSEGQVDQIIDKIRSILDFKKFQSWLCRWTNLQDGMDGKLSKKFRRKNCQLCPLAEYVSGILFAEFPQLEYIVVDGYELKAYLPAEGHRPKDLRGPYFSAYLPIEFRNFIRKVDHPVGGIPAGTDMNDGRFFIDVDEACNIAEGILREEVA